MIYGLPDEEWRDVIGYEGRYRVSNLGRVMSLPNTRRKTSIILKPSKAKRGGYLVVRLTKTVNGRWAQTLYTVHKLVAHAFIGERPFGMEVCHGDGCPTNAALTNLRYDTPKSNQADKLGHGTSNRGANNPQNILTEEQVLDIRRRLKEASIAEVSRNLSLNYSTVRNISQGHNWSWL